MQIKPALGFSPEIVTGRCPAGWRLQAEHEILRRLSGRNAVDSGIDAADRDRQVEVVGDGVEADDGVERSVCAYSGTPGAAKTQAIFRREIDIIMAQIGATMIADLGPQFLMWKDEEDLRRNRR
jgi:hypothetical protein